MADHGSEARVPNAAPLGHRAVIAIAGPIMLSNATTPLVGFVDTLVIGQTGSAPLIGGVALAAMIFNYLYWVFGFLRMGTTGLTAQAEGARDDDEVAANLVRALAIAATAGLAMIALQAPIAATALSLVGPSPEVATATRAYFDMRIWAAPAGLVNFALMGWFIGLGRAGIAFWLQILLNVLNMGLVVVLVLNFGLGAEGAGLAAMLAENGAAVAGLLVAALEVRRRGVWPRLGHLRDRPAIARLFAVNRDILIRTFCVITATAVFFAEGAQTSDEVLAANALLHSIAMITIYLLDGFAFAAETLVGQAVGARDRRRFDAAVRLTTLWAGAVGLALAIAVYGGGGSVIAWMTPNAEVRRLAGLYLVWAALSPLVGVWCFQLDGIFIGATRTAEMRNMMLVSFAIYLAAWATLQPAFGNHGLWAATMVFYIVRALTLWARYPALVAASFPAALADAPPSFLRR